MSTLKNNITAKRIALLASKGEVLFHVKDLANIWSIFDSNTLRVTLKRYTDSGILYRIYRGFYSLFPPPGTSPFYGLDPIFLGAKAIHDFCYLSTESVLYQSAYIHQKITSFTFVSEKSVKFEIGDYAFTSRQLHPRFLYQSEGVLRKEKIFVATPERAIADMLYFNPYYHFDRSPDWKKIFALQKKIGYPLTPHRYDFAKIH